MAKNKLQSAGYFALLGMLIWPIVSIVGPTLEGRLMPVVVGTDLTRIVGDDENHTTINGVATKIRDCTYLKMEWFYGDEDGRSVLVPLKILEGSKIREDGQFGFGPWRLDLEESLVRDQSFALVYHRCHPMWDTITEFWP